MNSTSDSASPIPPTNYPEDEHGKRRSFKRDRTMKESDDIIVEGCVKEISDATFTDSAREDSDIDMPSSKTPPTTSHVSSKNPRVHHSILPEEDEEEERGSSGSSRSTSRLGGEGRDQENNVLMQVYLPPEVDAEDQKRKLVAELRDSKELRSEVERAFEFVQSNSTGRERATKRKQATDSSSREAKNGKISLEEYRQDALLQMEECGLMATNEFGKERSPPCWDLMSDTESEEDTTPITDRASSHRLERFKQSEQLAEKLSSASLPSKLLERINSLSGDDTAVPKAHSLTGARARRGRTLKQHDNDLEDALKTEPEVGIQQFLPEPLLDDEDKPGEMNALHPSEKHLTTTDSILGEASQFGSSAQTESMHIGLWLALQQKIRLLMKERAKQALRADELRCYLDEEPLVYLFQPERVPRDVRFSEQGSTHADSVGQTSPASLETLRPQFTGPRSHALHALAACQAYARMQLLNHPDEQLSVGALEKVSCFRTSVGISLPKDEDIFCQNTSSNASSSSEVRKPDSTPEIQQPSLLPREDPLAATSNSHAHWISLERFMQCHRSSAKDFGSRALTRGEFEFLLLARKMVKKRTNIGRSDNFFCGMCLRDNCTHYSRMMCRACAHQYKFCSDFVDFVCANDELKETINRGGSTKRLVGKAYDWLKSLSGKKWEPVSVSAIAKKCGITLADNVLGKEEEPSLEFPDANGNTSAVAYSSGSVSREVFLPWSPAMHHFDCERMTESLEDELSSWWYASNSVSNQRTLELALQVASDAIHMQHQFLDVVRWKWSYYLKSFVSGNTDVDLQNPFAEDPVPGFSEITGNSESPSLSRWFSDPNRPECILDGIPPGVNMKLRFMALESVRLKLQKSGDANPEATLTGDGFKMVMDTISEVQSSAVSLHLAWERAQHRILECIPSKHMVATISCLYSTVAYSKGIYGQHLLIVPASYVRLWHWTLQWLCPDHIISHYTGKPRTRVQLRKGWIPSGALSGDSSSALPFASASHLSHVCLVSAAMFMHDIKHFQKAFWTSVVVQSHGPPFSSYSLPARTSSVCQASIQLETISRVLILPPAASAEMTVNDASPAKENGPFPNEVVLSRSLPDVFNASTDTTYGPHSTIPSGCLQWVFSDVWKKLDTDTSRRARQELVNITSWYDEKIDDGLFSPSHGDVNLAKEVLSQHSPGSFKELGLENCCNALRCWPHDLSESPFGKLPSTYCLPVRLSLAILQPSIVRQGQDLSLLSPDIINKLRKELLPPLDWKRPVSPDHEIASSVFQSKERVDDGDGHDSKAQDSDPVLVGSASEIQSGLLPLPVVDWRKDEVAKEMGVAVDGEDSVDEDTADDGPSPDPGVLKVLKMMGADQQRETLGYLRRTRALLAKLNENGRMPPTYVPALLQGDQSIVNSWQSLHDAAERYLGDPVAALVSADGKWGRFLREAYFYERSQLTAQENLRKATGDSAYSKLLVPTGKSFVLGRCGIAERRALVAGGINVRPGDRVGDIHFVVSDSPSSSRVQASIFMREDSSKPKFFLRAHGRDPILVDGELCMCPRYARRVPHHSASTPLEQAPLHHGSVVVISNKVMVFLEVGASRF
eukprot:gb/GECG01007439.1/.p1 GENE.gb/GECG01007439.1/~~gb/GECG01007439.1/.p1  ORF type:complete len:1586 (+),score=226.99 gb/GECG01007439.1/:1-4758(+)